MARELTSDFILKLVEEISCEKTNVTNIGSGESVSVKGRGFNQRYALVRRSDEFSIVVDWGQPRKPPIRLEEDVVSNDNLYRPEIMEEVLTEVLTRVQEINNEIKNGPFPRLIQ